MKISLRQVLRLVAPSNDVNLKVGRDGGAKALSAQLAAKYNDHMVVRIEAGTSTDEMIIEVEEHAPVGFVAGCAMPPLP